MFGHADVGDVGEKNTQRTRCRNRPSPTSADGGKCCRKSTVGDVGSAERTVGFLAGKLLAGKIFNR